MGNDTTPILMEKQGYSNFEKAPEGVDEDNSDEDVGT